MGQRPIKKFHPDLERFEEKQLLSAVAAAARAHVASPRGATADAAQSSTQTADFSVGGAPVTSPYELFRITDTGFSTPVRLTPPFQMVSLSPHKPVPGQEYTLLAVAVRNGTHKTFTAADRMKARLSTIGAIPPSFPVLTGNEEWKPGQFIVFYVLSKNYYDLSPQIQAGITFNFIPGAVIIPGPSSIQQHVKYDPAPFSKAVDFYVAYGQGPELGKGAEFGLPDTAIWEFVHKGQYIGRNAPRGAG